MILAVPADAGVKLLEQVAVPRVAVAAKVQVEKVPVTTETVKVTEPVGVIAVPRAELSVTVAVQTEVPPNEMLEGKQLILVVVVLKLTVTLTAVLVLPL